MEMHKAVISWPKNFYPPLLGLFIGWRGIKIDRYALFVAFDCLVCRVHIPTRRGLKVLKKTGIIN